MKRSISSEQISNFYNTHYSNTDNQPYQRDKVWLTFFSDMASQITDRIQPSTVLDVGCAMGFLVEGLRQHDVEAYGIDRSDNVNNIQPSIAPFCTAGSLADPLPHRYDLIVCIEVLEHLPQIDAEQAIANFCQASDDILFSSTPFDYREATHINVHPSEYWAEQFAKHNFFRDVDFDASFITDWTIRFRRKSDVLPRIIRDYERRFWLLNKENLDLRNASQEMSTELQILKTAQQTEQTKTIETLRQNYATEISEAQQTFHAQIQSLDIENQLLKGQWLNIERTLSDVVLQKLQDLHARVSTPDSSREVWLTKLSQMIVHHRLPAGIRFLKAHYHKILRSELGKLSKMELEVEFTSVSESYQTWIAHNEPTPEELTEQRKMSHNFAYRPLVSIVTPVYDPSLSVLERTIESVLAQTYDNWQLCLANGSPERTDLRVFLDQLASQNPKIKVSHLSENLGISGNTNEALKFAQGDYIAFLDHDDLLAPNMLYELVTLLNHTPELDIIYFDEDKLSENGLVREEPFFKPDWSPHMLLCTNYLTHPVCRHQFLLEVGLFDPQLDGAQDWDFVLRCTFATDKIYHIPKILYHWRKVKNSTASGLTVKPWVYEAQIRSLKNHLQRLGIENAQVTIPRLSIIRLHLPHSGAKVSIIIPTKNKTHILSACISSILELTSYPNYEIIIVDNGSDERTTHHYYKSLAVHDNIKVIEHPVPFNYSALNNVGVRHASGDILLFLNNDTEVLEADWLDELVSWVERPEIGIVGAKLLRPDDTIQHAGVIMGIGHCDHIFNGQVEYQASVYGLAEWYRDFMAVTGACLMIQRDLFEEVGGFDETYKVSWSDVELCLRVKMAGYTILYTPFARLLHHEGASRGKFAPTCDLLRATVQFLPFVIQDDPYFNPNLSYAFNQPNIVEQNATERQVRLLHILQGHNLISQIDKATLERLPDLLRDTLVPWPKRVKPQPIQQIMLVSPELRLTDAAQAMFILAQSLRQLEYEVTVYASQSGPLQASYEQNGILVKISPYLVDGPHSQGDSLQLSGLVVEYDLVIANTLASWRVIHAARAFQRPSIWWIHEPSLPTLLPKSENGLAFSTAERVLFPHATIQATYRNFSERENYSLFTPDISQMIVPNLPATSKLAGRFTEPADKFTLVYPTEIKSGGGQDILMQALVSLPPAIQKQICCYFVGPIIDSTVQTALQQLTSETLVEIEFVEPKSISQINQYLTQSDLVVAFPERSHVPLGLMQAMTLAKPVLTTDLTPMTELIDHAVNGLLVSVRNSQAIAVCLLRLFYDQVYRLQLGQAGQQKFERQLESSHSFNEQVKQLIETTEMTA
ncbi:glycosyltransferase [Anaerolineales bacterium HSG25]|nr:glycosyltransferase [Anaerolineales bacterium HSG25]